MTHTGYTKERPETIQSMFSSIAADYDRGNAIMSFNLHRFWNRALVHEVRQNAQDGHILDLCCGTGEIALTYLQNAPAHVHGYLLDFCPEMLHHAKVKLSETGLSQPTSHIHYIQGDAQDVPLESESVNYVTVAYGIRNVKDPAQCCREAFRVLKPGGRFGILELTRPEGEWMKKGHTLYLKTLVPLLGKLVASNEQAYQYLRDSIQEFISPDELQGILKESGFQRTWKRPLLGGVATIIVGSKK